MPGFDKKQWLDTHVLPLLKAEPLLHLISAFWNGLPPKDVLVFVGLPAATLDYHVGTAGLRSIVPHYEGPDITAFDPTWWPFAVKRLLEQHGFVFDYTREVQMVKDPDGGPHLIPLFGGDGSPVFGKNGMASVRLFKQIKEPTKVNLILQVGGLYEDGIAAAAAVKSLFGLFEDNPVAVVQKYAAPFGQA